MSPISFYSSVSFTCRLYYRHIRLEVKVWLPEGQSLATETARESLPIPSSLRLYSR